MIDRHGWTVDMWNRQSLEQKAIVIASLEHWARERHEQAKRMAKR